MSPSRKKRRDDYAEGMGKDEAGSKFTAEEVSFYSCCCFDAEVEVQTIVVNNEAKCTSILINKFLTCFHTPVGF